MTAGHRATEQRADASIHYAHATRYHREASQHDLIGKHDAHAARQALAAHGRAIAAAAIDRLAWDVAIARDTVVTVESGRITLTGEVDPYYRKDAAEQDVGRLLGVVGVSNLTTIKPRVTVCGISDDIFPAMHCSWSPGTTAVENDISVVL
jgi:osmotically-inducible protein OsmY